MQIGERTCFLENEEVLKVKKLISYAINYYSDDFYDETIEDKENSKQLLAYSEDLFTVFDEVGEGEGLTLNEDDETVFWLGEVFSLQFVLLPGKDELEEAYSIVQELLEVIGQ